MSKLSRETLPPLARALVAPFLLLTATLAAAQTPPGQKSAGPPEVVTTVAPHITEPKLRDLPERMKPHLVRVRVYLEVETRRVDGLLVERHRVDLAIAGGLVVSDDPLIMVSDSVGRIQDTGAFGGRTQRYNSADRRYEIVLDDGAALPAEVTRTEAALNFVMLRPADPSLWPAEKRAVTALGPRPAPKQHLGIVGFTNPLMSGELRVYEDFIAPDSAEYARPALVRLGLGHVGLPVFDVDGLLAGIVNMPGPNEPYPFANPNVPAVDPPAGRDPREWASGVRRPLLIPADLLAPLFRDFAHAAKPTPFQPLGLVLADRAGQLVVLEAAADGAAAHAGLKSGDVVVRVGPAAVASVDAFSGELERAMTGGAKSLALTARRGAEEIQASLDLP